MATEEGRIVEEEAFADGPRRRVPPAAIAGLGAVLLVGLFLAVRPMLSGDNGSATPAPGAAAATPASAATATPIASEPPQTFEIFGSKDPFRPLVVEGAPGAPGAPAAPGASPPGAGAPGAGGTSDATSPGAAGGSAPVGGQRVGLLDLYEEDGKQKAKIRVGSTVHTVEQGEVFATSFKLVSVSGNCASMLQGDDKFTLCEGEEVLK